MNFIFPGEEVSAPTKTAKFVFPDEDLVEPIDVFDTSVGIGRFKRFPTMPKKTDTAKKAKAHFSEEELGGLEYGEPIPLTKTFKLMDMLGNKTIDALLKVGAIPGKLLNQRGISQRTVDQIKGGSDESLEQMQKTLEFTKSAKYGDEVLGVESLGGVSDNFFEKSRFYSQRVPEIEADLRKKTNSLFPGATKLQDDITKAVDDEYKIMDAKVNKAYKDVEDLGDETISYNATPMREDILKTLRDEGYPEPVIRNIKRNLFYQERNLTDAEKGAQRILPGLDEGVETSAAELGVLVPKGTDGRKDLLNEAKKKADELRATPKENRDIKLVDLNSAIKTYEQALDARTSTEALLPNLDNINEKEFMRLIQEINRKKFVGGGDMGKYDMVEQQGLTKAKRMVEDYFEAQTASTNPGISEKFKKARRTYAEKIKRFGPQNRGAPDLPELGKLVKDDYREFQDLDSEAQINSLLKSPRKIETIGKILDEQNPGTTKKMAEEWLNKELGVVKQGETRLFDEDRVDTQGLRDQLDSIVSDTRKMEFITKTLGPEKAQSIKSLHRTTAALDTFTKSIKKEDGARGIKSASDEIGWTKPLKTLKILKDYINDSGSSGAYSTEVMDRVSSLIKRTQTDNVVKKARAMDELNYFVEHELTRQMGKVSPTALGTNEMLTEGGEIKQDIEQGANTAARVMKSGYRNVAEFIGDLTKQGVIDGN